MLNRHAAGLSVGFGLLGLALLLAIVIPVQTFNGLSVFALLLGAAGLVTVLLTANDRRKS